ncbi:MAG: hypothetical protein AAGJ83_13255, partial [Planctomycetota bacterium]
MPLRIKAPALLLIWLLGVCIQASDGSLVQCAAQELESEPVVNSSTEALDRSTAPFQFQCSQTGFPFIDKREVCQLAVRVNGLVEASDQALELIVRLVRVADGEVVAKEQTRCQLDENGDSNEISILDETPSAGVYELRCRLAPVSDPLWSRFQRKPEDVASVAVPVVIANVDVPILGPERTRASAPIWSTPRVVPEVDPDTWQVLQWVPGHPNRIMPNVKRVGETLVNSAWLP